MLRKSIWCEDMKLTGDQLEKINLSMKVLILASTFFFMINFMILFFGLFGFQRMTSQEAVFALSPVLGLILVFSLLFNITRYRCPQCRTFIDRRNSVCPVCREIGLTGSTVETGTETLESSGAAEFLAEEPPEEIELEENLNENN